MASAPSDDRKPSETPKCSTSRAGVVVDGVVTGVLGVSALAALSGDEGGVALGLAALGTAFILSARAGARSATDCEGAIADHETWLEASRRVPSHRAERAAVDSPSEKHDLQPADPDDTASTHRARPEAVDGPRPVEKTRPVEKPAGPRDNQEPGVSWADFWIEVRP